MTAVQKLLNLYNTEEDPNKFLILDNLKIPISKLNQIRSSAKRVFRSLYKFFDSEEEFTKNIIEFIKNEADNTFNEDLVSKPILTKYINEFFSKKPQEKIDKKDIECFLSNFNYNKHGFTQASVIPNLIYKYFFYKDNKFYGFLEKKIFSFIKEWLLEIQDQLLLSLCH